MFTPISTRAEAGIGATKQTVPSARTAVARMFFSRMFLPAENMQIGFQT
jgi:hypothetical protein